MERIKGYAYLLCAFGLAGTSVIAASFVSGRLGTFTITCMGLLFSLVCLLPFCMAKLLRTIRLLPPRQWLLLFCQALFGVLLFRMFLLYGLSRTSSVEAGILTGATPAITVFLAVLVLREKMKAIHFLGVIGTVCGILLIQGVFMPVSHFSNDHISGNILVLCAAGCESMFNILSRASAVPSSIKQEAVHPVVQTTLVSAMAWLISLIPCLAEQPFAALSSMGWQGWLALVWYGPVVTALAFICWYAGIRRCSAGAAAAFSGMMPFTSLTLSVWLLKEHAGWPQWAGGLLVIAGMVLIGSERDLKPTGQSKNRAALPKRSGT
ncbi:DMT family transporter [Paenibacillus sp. XY044]|uniref:DMT family transporter n=1 Tax=Paenibacillus sp. XY044 TaxID=2026089 RepID=UPI000B983930|nr:DMT family transporter [Paenibacillus sp. XY044]OZB98629.1 EamA family transporter [Paenibacillus sp. XY044]